MESDKDIKTWDQRLKDQSIRHWENYVHRRIDLSTARVDEPVNIPGEFIVVEDASDEDVAVAKIKFQKNTNDALNLELGVEIYTVFTQVFITNDALEDEWIDLIFGINFIYKKKIAGGDGFVNPIVTDPGVDLVLLPGAGGITQIGDAGAASHLAAVNDNLFVSGRLEVDGISYFDSETIFTAASAQAAISVKIGSDVYLVVVPYSDDGLHWAVVGTDGKANANTIFTLNSNRHKDHDHNPTSVNPTIFVHSATDPDTANTEWISLTHDQTDAVIASGKGNIKLNPQAGSAVVVAEGLVIPSGITPGPAVEGALYLDTDAGANGTIVMYSNGAWRTVQAF